MSMRELKIYLDFTGDIVKSNKLFKPNMIIDNTSKAPDKKKRYSSFYAYVLYYTKNVQYTTALFEKYKLTNIEHALDIFSNKLKSKRFFTQLEKTQNKPVTNSENCPPKCSVENISFLLDILFKKKQAFFYEGKKYFIAKVSYHKDDFKNGPRVVRVELKLLDSSKSQGMLAYYDCDGKKQQLKTQLESMFPSVFDFFDIDNPEQEKMQLNMREKRQEISTYKTAQREYDSKLRELKRLERMARKETGENDPKLEDKIEERKYELENLDYTLKKIEKNLLRKKVLSRSDIYYNKTRRTRRDRYRDRYDDLYKKDVYKMMRLGLLGGKSTGKKTRKKGRVPKMRRATRKNGIKM
jgi:hypothetical protein